MCEHERAQHPSRPLFKEKMAHAPEERQATTAMEPLEKVGPRSRWPWVGRPVGSAGPRVGPLVPPFGHVLPQWLKILKIWCTAKSLLEKMSKLLLTVLKFHFHTSTILNNKGKLYALLTYLYH